MKKLLVLIFILFCPANAFCAQFTEEFTAVGQGSENPVLNSASAHTVSCRYQDVDTSITAVTFNLSGSIDKGTTFEILQSSSHAFSASEITNKKAMVHIVNAPIDIVQINLTTLTGENSTDTVFCSYKSGR